MSNGLSFLTASATVALVAALPAERSGQPPVPPIVVPFERAPSPYIVIRVPVSDGPCEALIFDTGTTTTLLAPALAARVGLSVGQATVAESLNGSARAIKGEVRGIGFDGVPAGGPRVAIATDTAGLRGFAGSIAGVYGHNWMTGTDYLIDYRAKRIVMGPAGMLPLVSAGNRTPLTWAAGLPTVIATVRAHAVEPFSVRFVLDSGADHVTLFGQAAERMALVADPNRTMRIDSLFGPREAATATVSVNVAARERRVAVELRTDVKDREADGLLPTSLFHSVFVSGAAGIVIFDASPSPSNPQARATQREIETRDGCRSHALQ